MRKGEALKIVGGLSKPSKMPGHGTSLPASACKTGSKLRQKAGSVCEKCYACKGNYTFKNVQKSLHGRLDALDNPQWVEAMVAAIEHTGDEHFRWHDSGDIQSLKHLKNIIEVCRRLPKVKFWLPTKERLTVKRYLKNGAFPSNLVVRVSSPMMKQAPQPVGQGHHGLTSTVDSDSPGFTCPVAHGWAKSCNEAGNCRACWNSCIPNVDYSKH